MKCLIAITALIISNGSFGGSLIKDTFENISQLPINGHQEVLFSVGPLNIPKGAIVDIRFQSEMTNDRDYNVGIGRKIIRAYSPLDITGDIVNRAVMSNVTPNEHHEVIVHSNIEQTDTEYSGVYYNVVVWAVSDAGGGNIRVEQYYGDMLVEIR